MTSCVRILSTLGVVLAALLFSAGALPAQQPGTSPVKVFILVGQSNMVGHGTIAPAATPGTLEHTVANDPGGNYQFLKNGSGGWAARDDTWIHYERSGTLIKGNLTTGYGGANTSVGPELGFGHFAGDLYENQVLLIKAAWGGKSLNSDFRPPSSGWSVNPPTAVGQQGFYYKEILRLVNAATTNLGTHFPNYNGQGYQIVGFCWHQGWNDLIDTTASANYEANMANFIRDIRTDLGTPDLPFAIATSGMDGATTYTQVEQAQLAMLDATKYPGFVGNVKVVDTSINYDDLRFWHPADFSPISEGYHWNRNAKTYVNIGLALGDQMSLMVPDRCPYRLRALGGPGGVTLTWQNGTETPTSVRVLRNGIELASAAPVSPASFLDAGATPGLHNYELQFTMPVTPCDPLTTTFNGGITGLKLSREPVGFVLTWNNNMAYSAIEVRRNGTLLGSPLAGTATTFTDTTPLTTGVVTYTVAPTAGTSTPASVQVNLSLRCQLGILDLAANGGMNPATGAAWKTGDTYRFAFVSSGTTQATSTDITTYNSFVQNLANAASLGAATWKAVGSTAAIAARDNTGTNPTVSRGESIFLLDGVTRIATGNVGLWGGLSALLNRDELGHTGITGSAFTGSMDNGTKNTDAARVLGGSAENPPRVGIGDISRTNGWMRVYNAAATASLRMFAISMPLQIIDSGPDTTAPAPNPMSWATPPAAASSTSITMTATTASDPSGVQYFFDCTTAGGHDSAWQDSPTYTDTGLSPGTAYSYQVRARDKSTNANETAASSPPASATTPAPDTTAPTPNPMSWATPPAAVSSTSITMTATTASDPSGVQYFFDCTTPGGHDSAWQDSPTYTDTGLTPGTAYTYLVRARDKSINANETAASSPPASATTPAPDTTAPTPNPMSWATPPTAASSTAITMTATTASDPSGVQYFFDCTTAGGHDSAWQDSPTYTDTGLTPGSAYSYQVKARDKSTNANETSFSTALAATTNAAGQGLTCPLGVWTPLANGGINPATGSPWQSGNQYRLGFITSLTGSASSADIATYNAFVQNVANNSTSFPNLKNGTWKVLGSTATVSAKVNTGTDTGTGVPVILMDGTTVIATNNTDLWNGTAARTDVSAIYMSLYRNENGVEQTTDHIVFTGTNNNGTSHTSQPLGVADPATNVSTGKVRPNNGSRWMLQYSGAKTSTQRFYALSDPLTVQGSADSTPPTLASTAIVDDKNAAPVTVNALVTYTVTFSEDMNHTTVAAADFGNAGSAVVTIGTVVETTPGVFTVPVTPTTAGTLRLRINQNAELKDLAGNALITTSAILDDTTLTVHPVYASWATGPFDATLADTNPALDFDSGGLDTGIEWVVGGDPTMGGDDSGLAPAIDTTTDPAGKVLFSFRRSDAANADANTAITVEYGNNLTGWTTAVHQGTGPDHITLTEANDFHDDNPGIDKVTVAIPRSLAAGGGLFARLRVVVTPP